MVGGAPSCDPYFIGITGSLRSLATQTILRFYRERGKNICYY